jgi:hypothetical protein
MDGRTNTNGARARDVKRYSTEISDIFDLRNPNAKAEIVTAVEEISVIITQAPKSLKYLL